VDAVSYVRWLALSLGVTLAACAWWAAGRRGVEKRIDFNHSLHLEQGVDCKDCHVGITEAENLSKSYMPVREPCAGCHEPDSNGGAVAMQLPTERPPVELSEKTLSFSHKNHVARVEGECTRCHSNAKTATELPVERPPMSRCLTCHNHKEEYEASRCLRCHPNLQKMPLEALAEFNHAGNWLDRHGMLARSVGATCNECHPQVMCTECHSKVAAGMPARLYPERVERSLIHRGDWLSAHPIEARAEGDMCLRCHKSNYCQDCHNSFGMVGRDRPNRHPAGWMVKASGEQFHGRQARERIETCVACHDQGASSNCVDCHRVGGPGGNPHPAGWGGRYGRDDQHESKMCKTCHT
jgi:hypothetical protein